MLITEPASDHGTTQARRRRDGFSHHQASGWSIAVRYVSITSRMTSSIRQHDPAASREGQSRIPDIRPVIGENTHRNGRHPTYLGWNPLGCCWKPFGCGWNVLGCWGASGRGWTCCRVAFAAAAGRWEKQPIS